MPDYALTRLRVHQVDSDISDIAIDEILGCLDEYIRRLAEKMVPRTVVSWEMLDLEVDEIVQNTRIKLWQTLQRRHVIDLRAYARCIVCSEAVNIVRRYRRVFALPLDEDGELYGGKVLISSSSQGMQDPAHEFESEEALADFLMEIVDEVLALPRRQQQAMMSVLKDWAADIVPLARILIGHGVDIEREDWPEEQDELQRLRASRSIARRKLRRARRKDGSVARDIGYTREVEDRVSQKA